LRNVDRTVAHLDAALSKIRRGATSTNLVA